MSSKWCTPAEYSRFKSFLLEEAKGKPKCFYCKQPIDVKLSARSGQCFTIDHLKPKSSYPQLAKTISNMVAAHKSCNSSKGTQTTEKAFADIARRQRGTRMEWDPPNFGG